MVSSLMAVTYNSKMLSYRSETALQGASFGQKWRTGTGRQYFTDIFCRYSLVAPQR